MTRVASSSMGATSISSVVAVGILSLQRTLRRCNSCTGSVAIRHKGFPKKIQKHPANHKHPKDQSIHQPQHPSLDPRDCGSSDQRRCAGLGAAPWMSWRQCLHLPAAGLLIWLTFVALGGWPPKEVLSSRQLTDLRRGTLQDMLVVADETMKCVGRLVDNPNCCHVQLQLYNQ